ncbi:MAG: peptidase domain-containing ABC transporter [Sulfuricella sp.]|nr:peptidase domain-containing ABC transporter [Sulfuricella sp.]
MGNKKRVSREGAVWALGSLCRLHNVPFDARLLLQRHPPGNDGGFGIAKIVQAAAELDFVANEVAVDEVVSSVTTALPCLAFLRPVSPEAGTQMPSAGDSQWLSPALVTHVDSDRVIYFEAGSDTPNSCTRVELASRFEAMLYHFTPKPEPVRDEDGAKALAERPFGFTWFIPELLKHRKVWRDILAASLALQLVGLATPLFTQVVIDKVVVHQTQSTLIAVGIGLALSIVFSSAFSWVRQYLVLHTGNRVDAVLGSRVFGHLLKLPMPYFAHRPTGTLVARLQGVETIREFLSGAAVAMILDLPFMTVLLAVMFWYSWQLSLIVVGLLILLALLSLAVTPLFRERLNRQFLLGARNQAFVTEYISGMETLKTLQLEPQLNKRYGRFIADYLAAGFDTKQIGNTYNTAANALEQLQGLAVLVVGALLVMKNDGFTIGMLVAFQMFAGRLSQPMLRLVGLYQEFQQANLSVKRLGDLMNAPPEPYSLIPTRSGAGPGAIELEGISFRYSEDHPWLYRELSFSFEPGKTTLIMGPSGSGKSTLAKLLLGFYRPGDGRILLDGQDIRHFSANELRARFGVVPQETMLYSGTIYENLQMANPLAGFEDIVKACRLAEIHDTIEKLPQGYQTEIGEHGVGLSGGQKQRVAIARALLKRPSVLIFDEATSNLDAHTSEHFAKTINQLKGKATILFIAHQVPKGLQVDETVMVGAAGKTGQHDTEETEVINEFSLEK